MNKLSRLIIDFRNGGYPFKKPVEVSVQLPLGSSYGDLKARRVIKKKLASLFNGLPFIVRQHSESVSTRYSVNDGIKVFNKKAFLLVLVETSEIKL